MLRKVLGLSLAAAIACFLVYAAFKVASAQWAAKEKQIVFVPKTIEENYEFWQTMKQGVFAAAQEYGAEVRVVGADSEFNIDGQIRLLEQEIAMGPQAIVLAAADYELLVPVADKIVKSGMKLVTVDSGLSGDLSSSFIATNNVAAGEKAGKLMNQWFGPGDTVAIISFVKGSATAMEREEGVRNSLEEAGISVIDTYYCYGSVERSYEIAANILENHSHVRGIIGLNEISTVGAGKAIQELQAADRVKLVGFDNSMEEIAFLEEGILQATIVQKPFNMGYLAVKTAVQAIDGERVSALIDTGSEVITKANMYTKENQKLLFPFVEK